MENITVTLNFGEIKKSTVLFTEKVESEFYPAVIGDLYLPKSTVAELVTAKGWTGGDIIVEIGKTGDIKLMPESTKTMTVKFIEESGNALMPDKIGRIYIPKYTLKELGYCGDALYMSIKVPETTAE